MTHVAILTQKERRKFDMPPNLTAEERNVYFSLNAEENKIVQSLRSQTNQVGFLMQLGYFKANGKFFSPEQFRQSDIEHVANILNVSSDQINLSNYHKQTISDHRQNILEIYSWKPFDKTQQKNVAEYVTWLVQRQLSGKNIFLSLIDFCWQHKIELPSYNSLATIISNGYNAFEQKLTRILARTLTQSHHGKLNQFIRPLA